MLAAIVECIQSGSRKADGTPNASGRAWFYSPGSNAPTVVYLDANAEVQATQPITLSAAGKAEVYAVGPYRIVLEQLVSTGVYSTIDDFDYVSASAPSVAVRNDGFTGVDPDTGSQVAGGDTNLHAVLTSLNASVGGPDALVKESSGATARTIKAKFSEIWISVKDFGAVGNGIANDTTAIQAAINRVSVLGGGTVYFPPGTYLISAALTLNSKSGVNFIGTGYAVSQIKQTVAATNAISLSSCTHMRISGINLVASAANTGVGLSLADCVGITVDSIGVDYNNTLNSFDTCILTSGTSSHLVFNACRLQSNNAANARCLKTSGTTTNFRLLNSTLAGAGSSTVVEITGADSRGVIANSFFSGGTTGVSFAASASGVDFAIYACPSLGATYGASAISIGTATDLRVRQWANQVDGYTADVTSGGTLIPDRTRGNYIRFRLTSTGAGNTLAAPTPTPASGERGADLILEIFNNAGGAITAYASVNAIYHLTANPSVNNLDVTTYTLFWDADASVWRERSRTVTT